MHKIRHIGILMDEQINIEYLTEIRNQLMYENIKVLFIEDIAKGIEILVNKGIKYLIICSKKIVNKEILQKFNIPFTLLPQNEIAPQNFAHNIQVNLNFLDLQTNNKGLGYTDIYFTSDFNDLFCILENKKLNISLIEKLY